MIRRNISGRIYKLRSCLPLVCAALVAYLPLVFSSPGKVGADTKTYLYLDPSRLLAQAPSLWDSDFALGTVTHQTIGYLWPMGPYYWLAESLGSPDWLAQRVWLGSILFAAASGVFFLLKTLDWRGRGLLVAMLAYELSPYLLHYSARISVVLLPYAGLPWLLALTIRATRHRGWRYPGLFALVVATVGSVNATSLLLVGIAPVLWLLHAWGCRTLTMRQVAVTASKIAVTSIAVSLWWIAGLVVQSRYGLAVTRYTESYEAVASASSAPEVMRGLGYWFFYGNDKFGQWIEPSIEYTQGVWLHFLSFGLVVFAALGAAVISWRYRSFFVLLIVVGGFVAIGAFPFDDPSLVGSAFKSFTRTDIGLALRSTPRALPMLVLGVATLLAVIVNALDRHWPHGASLLAVLIIIAVVLNNPAMWRVRMVEEHLQRNESIPEYWLEAISTLNASSNRGRVLEVPGSDFASYRWGNTVDPITPGLLNRGYLARELVPFGSPESAALLTAFDRRFQEDSLDLDAVVPISQLLSVDDLLHRADLSFERYRTPRPQLLADKLARAPHLGSGRGFGQALPNVAGPAQPLLDEVHLGIDHDLPHPSPVTIHEVPDALDIVRLRQLSGGAIIVGDAEGIVDVAGANLLNVSQPIWFAADLLAEESLAETVLAEPSHIVITDTNKKRAQRWGTLRENLGFVEAPNQKPLLEDRNDNRLPLFTKLGQIADFNIEDTRSLALQQGDYAIAASAYGNPVTYTNDDRAFFAVDGDLSTAWLVAAFSEARGEFLQFTFNQPTELSAINFVQPQTNRHITEIELFADGSSRGKFALDATSYGGDGQTVEFASVSLTELEIKITDLDLGVRAHYGGVPAVGFSEIRFFPALEPLRETIRTPVAFVDEHGSQFANHNLSVVLTRERSNPAEPVRDDPEREMHRQVKVPAQRRFSVGGAVRLSASASETTIDAIIGRSHTVNGLEARARSSGRLAGDLHSGASFAFDGDISTAWTGSFGPQAGQWLEFSTTQNKTYVERLVVEIVADETHSLPSRLSLYVDNAHVGDLFVDPHQAPVSNRIRLEHELGLSLSKLRIVAAEVTERMTKDWYSGGTLAMPIAIAEVDLGSGLHFKSAPLLDSGCQELLKVNGAVIEARITGAVDDALARRELELAGCEEIVSGPNPLNIETVARDFAFDLDQLVLTSERNSTTRLPSQARVEIVHQDDTSYGLRVPGSDVSRWLVLGQSHNHGWSATVDGESLGTPLLIDGFANAWLLPPGGERLVELRWLPQRFVNWALWLSLIAVVLVLLMIILPARKLKSTVLPELAGPALPQFRPLLGFNTDVSSIWRTRAVMVATLASVFAWINLPDWQPLALLIGALAGFTVARPRFASSAGLLAALSLGVAALAIMAQQWRFRYPPDFSWPQQFENVHILAVIALLLLFVDYLRSVFCSEEL